jgi:hypothetical protein
MRNDRDIRVWAHSFGLEQFDFTSENLRHDFHEIETRIELRFKDAGTLRIVWPKVRVEGQRIEPFYYIETTEGLHLRRPKDVIERFPRIGIIPLLSPIERDETVLDVKYVRQNLDGRLASRHFRNQLHALTTEEISPGRSRYGEFTTFAAPWLPELSLGELVTRMGEKELELDLFYKEVGSRPERNLLGG